MVGSAQHVSRLQGPRGLLGSDPENKVPPSFIVLLEDSAALIGISIAAVGIYLSARLQRPELDGFASILIGMLLAATAWLLARESKELLIGEPAHGSINASIRAFAESESCIEGVNEVLTVHLAPNQIVAILSLEFSDELRTPEIERCVEVLEKRIRDPEVVSLFVKPQTRRNFETARDARFGS
jgi:divalent metal cation (Fe/Co/Zn/Cd) transporter